MRSARAKRVGAVAIALLALGLVGFAHAAAGSATAGPPTVATKAADDLTRTSAVVSGTVNPNGLETSWWVEFGINKGSYIFKVSPVTLPASTTTTTVSTPLIDLKPGRTYHYRFVASNPAGQKVGSDRSFTTEQPPTAVTKPASSVESTSAKLNGKLNPKNQAATWWFEYGPTTSYGSRTSKRDVSKGTKDVSVSRTVRNLKRNETYHFRLVVSTDIDLVYGADETFSTGRTPTVITSAPTAVGATTAVLNGSVDPNGRSTTWWFEYGTSKRYEWRTPSRDAGSGSTPVNVSTGVTRLKPGVTYHARMVAKNSSGTARGKNVTFVTGSLAAAATGPLTQIGPTSATVTGTVNPNGRATTAWFEYGRTTSYGFRTTERSVGSANGDVPVAAQLTGLRPGVRYHYRLVARSEAGTVRGDSASFGTVAFPRDSRGRQLKCTIFGTPGPDVLRGTAGPDVICGFGGNDRILGRGGNDVIHGGPGNDVLLGGLGSDTLYGALGNDELVGSLGNDRLDGGAGRDGLIAGNGADVLIGSSGHDVLIGGAGNDIMSGGLGSDRFFARDGRRDVVSGGAGVNRVTADKIDVVRGARRVG